jgi:hypothetical protein
MRRSIFMVSIFVSFMVCMPFYDFLSSPSFDLTLFYL